MEEVQLNLLTDRSRVAVDPGIRWERVIRGLL